MPLYIFQKWRIVLIPIFGIFLTCIIWFIYWHTLSFILTSKITAWIDNLETSQITIGSAISSSSNFPYAINVESGPLTLFYPNKNYSWHTKNILFLLNPIKPMKLQIDLSGEHILRFLFGKHDRIITLHTEKAFTETSIKKNKIAPIQLGKTVAQYSGYLGELSFASGVIKPNGQITLRDVLLPDNLYAPLGQKIQFLSIHFPITAKVPKKFDHKSFNQWQETGGSINFQDFCINYGPLYITGNGAVTLNKRLQPEGAFSLSVTGVSKAIDIMANRGLISPKDTILIKIAIKIFSKNKSQDDLENLEISLTVQDGLLYAGPIPVLKIPIITWPK